MTDKQAKLLKKRNLDFFRQTIPGLHQLLENIQPTSQLVTTESGQSDVQVGTDLAYQGRLNEIVTAQLSEFWKAPRRFLLPALEPGQFDEPTNRFLNRLLRRAKDDGLKFAAGPTSPDSYYLVVFGIGLGRHLDELVEKTDCRFLMLADDNPEWLYHSLDTYDWPALMRRLEERNGALSFAIDAAPENLAESIIETLRSRNPCSTDGLTYFMHSETPVLTQALERFRRDSSFVLGSLGFFLDETLMLRNTYGNLSSGDATVFYRSDDAKVEAPAFVVASGPSLDADLPIIRDNADKAVIISSGSALRVLLKNGIVPDFHVEIENIAVLPMISQVVEDFDLSSICLVAATTVDQEAKNYFDQVVYFFRSVLSPFPLFSDLSQNCLLVPDPTVVNTSLSFAQETGFREIYFFGVDLGKRGEGRHHSKDSYHYVGAPIVEAADLQFDIPVPANFGGTSLTSIGLNLTRARLVQAIRGFQTGYQYYNCSDGASIDGAEPLPAKTLSLPDIPGGKDAITATVSGGFPSYSRDKFDAVWKPKDILKDLDDFVGDLVSHVDSDARFPDRAYLTDLMQLLRPEIGDVEKKTSGARRSAAILFRGTVFMMIVCIEHFLARIAEPGRRSEFARMAAAEFKTTVGELHEIAETTITDPSAGIPTIGADGEANAPIPEIPFTFGNVPRNAPCPCGSGKRFKQCHGKAELTSPSS